MLVTTIALAVSQLVKEKLSLDGAYAQAASSLVGAILGVNSARLPVIAYAKIGVAMVDHQFVDVVLYVYSYQLIL